MPAVLTERQGHLLIITLNRPERQNAINGEMLVRFLGHHGFDTVGAHSIEEATAAAKGSAACLGEASSPTSTSRLISRPTMKKKSAINPSLIQCRNDRLKSTEPHVSPTGVSQKRKNG